jgi:hypothetical protein
VYVETSPPPVLRNLKPNALIYWKEQEGFFDGATFAKKIQHILKGV